MRTPRELPIRTILVFIADASKVDGKHNVLTSIDGWQAPRCAGAGPEGSPKGEEAFCSQGGKLEAPSKREVQHNVFAVLLRELGARPGS